MGGWGWSPPVKQYRECWDECRPGTSSFAELSASPKKADIFGHFALKMTFVMVFPSVSV